VKLLQWPGPEGAPRSKRPYRDAALVYAGLAAAIVAFAALTGGSLARAAVTAAFFFVVATAWTWFHMRRRKLKEKTE
jgi:Flp pilus assembly protein TadB